MFGLLVFVRDLNVCRLDMLYYMLQILWIGVRVLACGPHHYTFITLHETYENVSEDEKRIVFPDYQFVEK